MINAGHSASWQAIADRLAALKSDIDDANQAMSGTVAVFGAGQCGGAALKYLAQLGANVICLVDNNAEKHGRLIDGRRIVSPVEMSTLSPSFVFIAARHAVLPIKKQLDELNMRSISLDAYILATRVEQLKAIRNGFFHDEKSLEVFDAVVNAMLTGNEAYCENTVEGNQNFALPKFMNTGKREHFVDAGAYVGDSVERFIWSNNGVFERIYAFEPGAPQFRALTIRMERLAAEWAFEKNRVECINAALADCNAKTALASHEDMLQSTSIDDSTLSGNTVRMYSLDSFLSDKPATFIKVDVEGMELRMLQGATATIQKFKPKIAISIYHNAQDLFEITEYLKSIVPEYRMALRQHAPVLMETVLYCWVEDEGVMHESED